MSSYSFSHSSSEVSPSMEYLRFTRYCAMSSFRTEAARSVSPSPASAMVEAWFSEKYRCTSSNICS